MNINRQLTPVNHSPGREGNKVLQVVLHTMVGSLESAQSRFFNGAAAVSAHYGIGLSGEIRQWVSEGDTGWHAGNWQENLQSIGIEHEDKGNYMDAVRTNELYASSIELITDICRRYGLTSTDIHVHNEYRATACPDGLDVARIRNGVAAALAGLHTQAPANTSLDYTPATGNVTVTVSVLRVRTGPGVNFADGQANTPDGALHAGTVVGYSGWKLGDGVSGNPVWLRSVRGNWFWSGGTNFNWQAVIPKAAASVAPAAPVAPVLPSTPEPVQVSPEAAPAAPVAPVAPVEPDWRDTYKEAPAVLYASSDYTVKDREGIHPDMLLKRGMKVTVAGVFVEGGTMFYRTQTSVDNGTFYGISPTVLTNVRPGALVSDIRPATPQPDTSVAPVPDWESFQKTLSARNRFVAALASFESLFLSFGRWLAPFKRNK